MKTKAPQLELRACADAFNLMGERGVDGARLIAEMAESMRRERDARAWQEKMQRKLAECPGFVGCKTVRNDGGIPLKPSQRGVGWSNWSRRINLPRSMANDFGRVSR